MKKLQNKRSGIHTFSYFFNYGWIDIFNRQRYRDIILESLKFCQENKVLQIGGYVIMSNHLHTVWTAGKANLCDMLRDFKTFASKAILASLEVEPERRRDWLLCR